MKPRNREVNIFNMSLLDILCGALGTFCFLMLVLFPYYSIGKNAKQAPDIPPGVDPKTLEEAKARIQQLEDTLKKFQDFSQDLQSQLTAEQAENQKLKDQVKSLSKFADKMEMRNPIVTNLNFIQDGNEDTAQVYVEDERQSADGTRRTPKADPTQIQPNFWPGDMGGYGLHGAYFVIRDTTPGKYRILLKVIKHDAAAGPFAAQGSVELNGQFEPIPRFYVTQAQAVVEMAQVTVTYGDKGYAQQIAITLSKEAQQPPPAAGGQQQK
jgi:cell division protein FtsB